MSDFTFFDVAVQMIYLIFPVIILTHLCLVDYSTLNI